MQISHLIVVLLLSCVKFFLAIPLAVTYDFTFWQTFILSCLGGIIGVLFFAYFRKVILNYYYKLFPNKKKEKIQ
jgi:uncharacterized oligopeptide transporter (OPT) family protein